MSSSEECSQQGEGEDNERPVRRVETVSSEAGDVDFGDNDGLVEGDVRPGAVIRGSGNVHIQGALTGVADQACRVEATGNVTVDGSVDEARLRGRRIRIGGDVANGRIAADLNVEIHGSIEASEVSLGNRTADLARLSELRADYERLETRLGEFRVKVGAGGRRFVRDYPQVDLATGGVIVQTKREILVDLSPFYKAVAGRTPDEVDKALEEFYLRVMVGSLTRANRLYVSRNPGRQKIFLKLIEDLRNHVRTVREADRIQGASGEVLRRRQALLDELKRPARIALKVGGQVRSDVTVRLVWLSRLEGTAAADVDIEKSQLEARTTQGEDGPMLEITDASGGTRSEPIGADGLSGGIFRAEDNRVVWVQEA